MTTQQQQLRAALAAGNDPAAGSRILAARASATAQQHDSAHKSDALKRSI